MDGYTLGMTIGMLIGITIGITIGISMARQYKPWSELTEKEKKHKKIIIGFGIIIWGISQTIQTPDIITPGIIASLAGIITEFIGATFLFVYKSIIKQASDYSKTLENINSVGMAMQILDTIPNDTKEDDLKNKTKAKLVTLLIDRAHKTPNTSKKLNSK